MPEAVRIEPLAGEDVERMAALAREIWHDHYPAIISTAQIDYMLGQRYDPAVVRAELAGRDIWWDKLVVGEELCGFSSYLLAGEPDTMKLDKLYVRTSCQRRGYGAMLIERALAEARRQGSRRLVLAVNKNNVTAIAAYLKHGFRIAEAMVSEIGGGFVMDDYIMEKDTRRS
jgi:ribosomal protein S18 acetylase RimI-like enzyme